MREGVSIALQTTTAIRIVDLQRSVYLPTATNALDYVTTTLLMYSLFNTVYHS